MLCGYGSGFFWTRYPHSARISRNRSAASRRDILRRDRSNRTSPHGNAATLSLISTPDSIRPAAACLTSTLMHKPTREHPRPPKKPAPNMKIQMPIKLPRLSMRHQPLLDPIDREIPRRLSGQVPFIHRLNKNIPIPNRLQTPSGSP